MDAEESNAVAVAGHCEASPVKSKKQLRQEKSKPSRESPRVATSAFHDADLPAFDRVKKLRNLDRFTGDIENLLTELIDKVLAQEAIEPRASRRDELATLLLWHAEFQAQVRQGGDKTVGSTEMRSFITELGDSFEKVVEKDAKDAKKTPYDTLIKVFSIKKNQKQSRRRRSEEHGD
ncbi:hypothetical protein C2857_005069 [Epichloe festucae Fl1]|uniref:Uncharacterized protein n=1 Tax=Epichloe festucae (strain Fl1) TaxID=877507 RepID=A0A7S9KKV4_EPIFF|nr:hypothetical protein C2857_005069 [Epichloe festucae Fl1]